MSTENFIHHYEAGSTADAPTLLLLHGTGGNENSLVNIGKQLAPGAAIISPRGKVLENGNPRFFRRLAEGVFDHEDLVARTHELADFIQAASDEYGFALSSLIAVGYSNGANIAASLMLLHPGLVPKAVLFRSMLPFRPATPLDLSGTSALLLAGRYDDLIAGASVEALASVLETAGANVTLDWQEADHRLTSEDFIAAQTWIARERVVSQR